MQVISLQLQERSTKACERLPCWTLRQEDPDAGAQPFRLPHRAVHAFLNSGHLSVQRIYLLPILSFTRTIFILVLCGPFGQYDFSFHNFCIARNYQYRWRMPLRSLIFFYICNYFAKEKVQRNFTWSLFFQKNFSRVVSPSRLHSYNLNYLKLRRSFLGMCFLFRLATGLMECFTSADITYDFVKQAQPRNFRNAFHGAPPLFPPTDFRVLSVL